MDEMTDDDVLESIRTVAATVPVSTVNIARAHGLPLLAQALARYTRKDEGPRKDDGSSRQ